MLGAVKGDDDTEGVPLFRVLARRWKSFAPGEARARRASSLAPADEQPKPTRAWIVKAAASDLRAPEDRAAKTARGWNPWLWMK